MDTLFVHGNSRVINFRAGDDSLVSIIKKFHLNVFPILNTDRLMTAYDLWKDDWRDMGNKSTSYLIMQRLNSPYMKLRLIYTDLCLKHVFENPTLSRNAPRFSVTNSGRCLLQLSLTFWCRLPIQNTTKTIRLASKLSRCVPFLSSIPTEKNPTVLSLETWLVNCGDPHAQSIVQRNDR